LGRIPRAGSIGCRKAAQGIAAATAVQPMSGAFGRTDTLEAQTGGSKVLAASLERGLVERDDLLAATRHEREVHRCDDPELLGLLKRFRAGADPEVGLRAATEAACLAELHHLGDAQRRERLQVERLGCLVATHHESDVIDDAHALENRALCGLRQRRLLQRDVAVRVIRAPNNPRHRRRSPISSSL